MFFWFLQIQQLCLFKQLYHLLIRQDFLLVLLLRSLLGLLLHLFLLRILLCHLLQFVERQHLLLYFFRLNCLNVWELPFRHLLCMRNRRVQILCSIRFIINIFTFPSSSFLTLAPKTSPQLLKNYLKLFSSVLKLKFPTNIVKVY